MYIGIILLCAANSIGVEQNPDTCLLFSSPTSYYSEEQCWDGIKIAIESEQMKLNLLALDLDIANLECYDVRRKKQISI